MDNTFIEEDFWKAIYSIPNKARHDNFHLSVIGRMHKSWANTLLLLVKLIMATRIIPKNINILSRIPIPKPEKPNEYRPLSVCDDLFCFVNSIYSKHAAAATERAQYLHDAVTAYRKGKGCSSLVSIELSTREDCIESGKLCALIMEDIEKFFDRLTAEVILNAMIKAGFPDMGYVEFKGSSMSFKKVLIQTIKGTIKSTFECGLEQGNPDSPRAANLVIMNIHNMWKKATTFNTNYQFSTVDKKDGTVEVGEAGYSDDNLVLLWNNNTGELIAIIQKKIDMTGDFSIVCKLGRKGSKCIIYLFNIPAEEAKKMIKFFSIAWSFSEDKPVREEIKIVIYLNKEEAQKLDFNNDGPIQVTYNLEGELTVETSENFLDLKHLGLTMDTQGNTTSSAKKIIKNIKAKILSLNIRNLKDNPQRHSVNMLLNSLHSYATLPNNIDIKDLRDCDKLLVSNLRQKKGLAKHDTSIQLFISEKEYGYGIKSFVDTYVLAIARELEVVLNSNGIDSEGSRGRLAAHVKYFDTKIGRSPSFNHISDAIIKLSHFGLFLRDLDDGLTNYFIEKIRIWLEGHPIGSENFSKNNEPYLGEKHKDLTDFIYGGKFHRLVSKYIKHKNLNTIKHLRKQTKGVKLQKTITFLNSIWEDTFRNINNDRHCLFNYKEWTFNPLDTNPISSTKWSFYDMDINSEPEKVNNSWSLYDTWQMRKDSISITPSICTFWENGTFVEKNKYGSIINKIFNSKSPLIIATDGGLSLLNNEKEERTICASASITWCLLKIKPNETIISGEWQDREVIPILQRSCALPKNFGTTDTDIGHAELQAFCMQEESLHYEFPRIVIMDSDSVRKRVLELRDEDAESERFAIRKLYGGLGKTLISKAFLHINSWKACSKYFPEQIASSKMSFPNTTHDKIKMLNNTMMKRNRDFISLINKLPENTKNSWKKAYKDDNPLRTIIEIDSHQLNINGNAIRKDKQRFPELIPNLALLNANYWADEGASLMIKSCNSEKHLYSKFTPRDLILPPNDLRFHVLYDGKIIDKNQSDFIFSKLEKERTLRLQKREFQGLIARIMPHSTTKPRDLARTSSHRRYLSNLSSTHTRACYKCKQYLALNIMEKEKCEINLAQTRFYSLLLTKNLLNKNRNILSCPNCKIQASNTELPNPRGNRRHYTHFCSNIKIKNFRDGTNEMIEHLLRKIWSNIVNFQGSQSATNLLSKINQLLLSDKMQNTGKLILPKTSMPTDSQSPQELPLHPNYVSIKEWCKIFNISDIQDGVNKQKPILQHILGFRTLAPDGALEEGNMGLTDTLGIGIIPFDLQNEIFKSFTKMSQTILDKEIAKSFKLANWKLWKRITSILKGRGIGLHRTIRIISKDREQELRTKFNLPSKKICSKNLEDKKDALRKEEDDELELLYTKTCKGPTCQCKDKHQNRKAVTPNRIKITHSICTRCINYNTASKRCNAILEKILSSNKSTCQNILNIIFSNEDINKITSPLMMTLIEEFDEIPPWLTKSNCSSYKKRGLKLGVRKPLQMIIEALRSKYDTTVTYLCKVCIKNDKKDAHFNCPVCKLGLAINHFKLYNVTSGKSKESSPTKKRSPEESTSMRNIPSDKLHQGPASPFIIMNIKNELQTLNSPKKRLKLPTPTAIPNRTPVTKISYSCTNTNSLPDENTPHSNPKSTPKNNHEVLIKSLKKKGTNLNQSFVECTSPPPSKKESSYLRLPNNITRSHTMNSLTNIINNNSPPNFHIANSNLISYKNSNIFHRTKTIPPRINFESNNAKALDLGTYIFPTFIGSFHGGNWLIICIQKTKNTTTSSSDLQGWIINPCKPTYSKVSITELATLESNLFFNRTIDWQSPRCLPLNENECGPRCIAACIILCLAITHNIHWQLAINEACNFSITKAELVPHFCREIAYKLAGDNKDIWKIHIFFPSASLYMHQENLKSKHIDEKIKNHTSKKTLNVKSKKKKKARSKNMRSALSGAIRKKRQMKKEADNPRTTITQSKNHHTSKPPVLNNKNISPAHPRISLASLSPNLHHPHTSIITTNREHINLQRKERYDVTTSSKSSAVRCNMPKIDNNTSCKKDKNPTKTLVNSNKKLTSSWSLRDIREILSTSTDNPDSIISRFNNNTITIKNLQTLKPSAWLNDEVINFFLCLAQADCNRNNSNLGTPPSHCYNTFFFTKLLQNNEYCYNNVKRFSRNVYNGNIFSLDKLLIPINENSSHWSLSVIDLTQKTICHYDSMGNQGLSYSRSCLRYLQDEFLCKFGTPLQNLDDWDIINNANRIPLQENNFDCGIFVCLFALHILNNTPFNFNQMDINRGTRTWIAKAILQKCIPDTSEGYCYTFS